MRLRARNDLLRYTGQVEFRHAELHVRWNRPSTFSVTLAEDQAAGLRRGSGLVFDYKGVVLSGLVVQRARRDDLEDDAVELSGRCDLHRLAGRLVYPDPAVAADGTQPNRWDRSGPAGEVLADMVDLNAGPSALADRRIFGLEVEDATGLGATVRAQRRFPTVAEEIERLGRDGGIVARLRQHDSLAEIRFTVAAQADKTRTVVFSEPRGNLAGYEVESELPEGTVAVVGGRGEGADRVIIEVAGDVASFDRWESWVDARNAGEQDQPLADHLDELETEAAGWLAEHGPQERIVVDTVETATSTWRDHWDVGDLVTVEVDGQRLTKTVEEVEVTVEAGDGPAGGPVVSAVPVLGRENPRSRLRLLSRLNEVEGRVEQRGKD